MNAFGFYSLANFYYRQRDRYVRELTDARFNRGDDLTPFLVFGLDGLVTELTSVNRDILDLIKVMAYRDYARESLEAYPHLSHVRRSRMLDAVRGLSESRLPYVSRGAVPGIQVVAGLYGRVSDRTLARGCRSSKDLDLVVGGPDDPVANIEVMN